MIFVDWRRMSVPKLIKGIEKQMNMELILIKNALSSQCTEFELAPEVAEHAIALSTWRKWSPQVRERALKEFLLGNAPFQSVFNVSTDGLTFHRKTFGTLACKPGSNFRKRTHKGSVLIHRSEAHSQEKYEF